MDILRQLKGDGDRKALGGLLFQMKKSIDQNLHLSVEDKLRNIAEAKALTQGTWIELKNLDEITSKRIYGKH